MVRHRDVGYATTVSSFHEGAAVVEGTIGRMDMHQRQRLPLLEGMLVSAMRSCHSSRRHWNACDAKQRAAAPLRIY